MSEFYYNNIMVRRRYNSKRKTRGRPYRAKKTYRKRPYSVKAKRYPSKRYSANRRKRSMYRKTGKVVYRIDEVKQPILVASIANPNQAAPVDDVYMNVFQSKYINSQYVQTLYKAYNLDSQITFSLLNRVRGEEKLNRGKYDIKGIKFTVGCTNKTLPIYIGLKKKGDANYILKSKVKYNKIYVKYDKLLGEQTFLDRLFILVPEISIVKMKFYFKEINKGKDFENAVEMMQIAAPEEI